ncbi:MAG TPA: FtsX-like permease family protein [Candidatus Wallbacteria bacterium]|nr:FtsX-like permease family protein [Candidatus Wallbacteria bacterium]
MRKSLELNLSLLFFKRSLGIGKYPVLMIAFATSFIIVIISLAEGFDGELVAKLIGVSSHIELTTDDGYGFSDYDKFIGRMKKEKEREIKGISAHFTTDAILSKDGASTGVRMIGVDLENERSVSPFFPAVINREKTNFLIVGSALFKKMGLKTGDEMKVTTLSRENIFEAAATFEIGIYDYDMSFVYCDIKTLQKILGFENIATSVLIRLENSSLADPFAEELNREFAGRNIVVRTWKDANKSLFTTIKIERAVLYFIIFLTIVLANIGIAFILALNVFRRAKSMAIMEALGTPSDKIARIFLYEGFFFGISGLLAGLACGIAACVLLGWLSPAVPKEITMYYNVTRLPIKLNYLNIFIISAIEIAVLFASATLSARSISRRELLETLRNN